MHFCFFFFKGSFRGVKNNYLEVKLVVYHSRMLNLCHSNPLHQKSVHAVPQAQLRTSTFFGAKWPT